MSSNGGISLSDSDELTVPERRMCLELLQEGQEISTQSIDAVAKEAPAVIPSGALGVARIRR